MPNIVIKIAVTDDAAELFAGRDMMVTPLSVFEAEQFAGALAGIEETTRFTCSRLAQRTETTEAKGQAAVADVEALRKLAEINRMVLDQIVFVRTMLGRSARVGPSSNGGGPVQ